MRRLLHDDQRESGLLPVLSRLIKQFVFKYQSRDHARDLVQALHVVIRLLERLSQNGTLTMDGQLQLPGNICLLSKMPDEDCHTWQRRGRWLPCPEEGSRST